MSQANLCRFAMVKSQAKSAVLAEGAIVTGAEIGVILSIQARNCPLGLLQKNRLEKDSDPQNARCVKCLR